MIRTLDTVKGSICPPDVTYLDLELPSDLAKLNDGEDYRLMPLLTCAAQSFDGFQPGGAAGWYVGGDEDGDGGENGRENIMSWRP